jgi:hypothetical protein
MLDHCGGNGSLPEFGAGCKTRNSSKEYGPPTGQQPLCFNVGSEIMQPKKLLQVTVARGIVESAIGSPYRPMSDPDLEAKFYGLTTDIVAHEESARSVLERWLLHSWQRAKDELVQTERRL